MSLVQLIFQADFSELSPLWIAPLAIVFLTNGYVAFRRRPLGNFRYILFLGPALSPALVPAEQAYRSPWGILTATVTTLAIVSAARLVDGERFFAKPRRPLESFLWMTLPMVRQQSLRSASRRTRQALSLFMKGVGKLLVWELLFRLMQAQTVSWFSDYWPLRSAALMCYFVLNLTAAADLLSALCLLAGYDIDLLFDRPLLAASPREFWSRRWNRFISRFALQHVARRVRGPEWWMIFTVFATSGVFHEYFAWGVGGSQAAFGSMSVFFLLQGALVWLTSRATSWSVPRAIGNGLTFGWMTLTAPLFFRAIEPALAAFAYPRAWYPF